MKERIIKMSEWCRALRSNEAHLLWITNNEERGKKLLEIENNFNCFWEDKFKEVCESYNLETAAKAIGLNMDTFCNWAKHLKLKPHHKGLKSHQEKNSPYNYFVEEDVKESMGLSPNITERKLLMYIQKNPNILKVPNPAKNKRDGQEIKNEFLGNLE